MTRMATSCGFSVSSKSMSRLISGSFALGAATMRRLEILSGQMRICCADAGAPPAPGGWPLGGCGGGVGCSGEGPPPKRTMLPAPSRVMELEELGRDEDGELGGA